MELKKEKNFLSPKSIINGLKAFKLKNSKNKSISNNMLNNYYKLKNKNHKINIYLIIKKFIIYNNIKKYNSNPDKKNLMIINNIIETKETHYLAIFKDNIINNTIMECFRKFYNTKESFEKMSRFYGYYKNYFLFFCKPTFSDFEVNNLIQDFGQNKAEEYYYKKEKLKQKIKNKKENHKKSEIYKSIFTQTIRNNIDNLHSEPSNINNDSILPSSIILSNDSKNSKKVDSARENTILNIFKIMKENDDNKKYKNNIYNYPIKKNLEIINQINNININSFHNNSNNNNIMNNKINFITIKKYNEFIESKDKDKKIHFEGLLTSRNDFKTKNENINDLFPKNAIRQYNSHKEIFSSKNINSENWRNRNSENKTINTNKNKKISKGIFYLYNNNLNLNLKNDKSSNYLYSLSTTKGYKNLNANPEILSTVRSHSKNNNINSNHKNVLVKNKKLFNKNLGMIIQSLKNTISPKNSNYVRSLSNSPVNNFNININNHIIVSNHISPIFTNENKMKDNEKKMFKSRNFQKNLLKIKTEINDYISYSNSHFKKSHYRKDENRSNNFLGQNYSSLNHKLQLFNQKKYSFKTLTLTSRNINKSIKGKSLCSLRIINNNYNNKKNVISDYKYK